MLLLSESGNSNGHHYWNLGRPQTPHRKERCRFEVWESKLSKLNFILNRAFRANHTGWKMVVPYMIRGEVSEMRTLRGAYNGFQTPLTNIRSREAELVKGLN
jgi:hypothetical protein